MTLETKTNENWTYLDATNKLKLLRLTLLACMNFKKGSGMVLQAKNLLDLYVWFKNSFFKGSIIAVLC